MALQAFLDAKAGENEHGVFWQTSKLREAYALAVAASEAEERMPWWHIHRPTHMNGWECFGAVPRVEPPTLRRLGTGYDGKGKPGTEKWGPGEVRLGVSDVNISTYAGHQCGAYIYVVGPEKDDVEARWHLAAATWTEMGGRLWPTKR